MENKEVNQLEALKDRINATMLSVALFSKNAGEFEHGEASGLSRAIQIIQDTINETKDANNPDLITAVQQWGKDKGITDPRAQFMKVVEEVGEIAEAYDKGWQDKLVDSFGDVQVTLIIAAELMGVDYEESLVEAYNVIAKRNGHMRNGVFVKEEDEA
jgi:Predicted pyrophosphatase